MPKTAEIFFDRGRQAIRLPEDIHVTGTQIAVRQNDATGEIILSPQADQNSESGLENFFKLRDSLTDEELAEFDIPRDPRPPMPRDIF